LEIAIVHPSLNKAGGAERYCIEMMQTLIAVGYKINLYTIDKTDWVRLQETQGLYAVPNREIYLKTEPLEPRGLFSWIWTSAQYLWLLIRGCVESDLCINNYGEVMPFFADASVVHSMPLDRLKENNYGIPFWGYVRRLYRYLYRHMVNRYGSPLIIANSIYNAANIQTRGRITVIHPPIKLREADHIDKNGEILTVSRIRRGKNLGRVAEIASYSPRNQFNIAGRTEYGSERIIKELLDLKNIKVYNNPKRNDILQMMKKCSIYLSTQPNEAFGMAVVEAMKLGCIPLVYRDGGPWIDTLGESEEYGLSYTSSEEAAEKINKLLKEDELRNRLRRKGAARAELFNLERFRAEIMELVEELEPNRGKEPFPFTIYKGITSLRKRMT